MLSLCYVLYFIFFFNDTATTEIYTLSLHDALPISRDPASSPSKTRNSPLRGKTPKELSPARRATSSAWRPAQLTATRQVRPSDRKSTRLNSSHANISYAVFCLKKKNKTSATSTSFV